MLYKIGDVAKLLGLSKECLRLYERRDMINPIKDDENGYRYYAPLDITALIRCRSYLRYGFSMKETSDLMFTDNMDFIINKYKKQELVIEEEINFSLTMLKYLKSIRSVIESINENLNKCKLVKSVPMYRFEYMHNHELCVEDKHLPLFHSWIDKVPMVALSILWGLNLHTREINFVSAGMCIPEEFAKDLKLYTGVPVEYLEERDCVYTIFTEDNDNFISHDCINFIIDYMDKNSLKCAGNPYCRTFLSMDKGGNYTRFREIWFPCEKCKTS